MNRVRIPLALATATALAMTSVAPALAQDAEPALDLDATLSEFVGLVPGGAVALTVRDDVVTEAAFGVANANGDPMTVDTPFRVGQVTWPFIATMVLQLVDEGRVDLDEPVSTYVPDAPVAAAATVRDLLTRRSGLPGIYGLMVDASMADPAHSWTIEERLAFIDAGDSAEVGTYQPSIANLDVLSLLIAAADGGDIQSSLATRIVEPLGLEGTVMAGAGVAAPDGLAAGFLPDLGFDGDPATEAEAMGTIEPMTATVGDLGTFATALIGGELLSDESMALMFDASLPEFGYGWDRVNQWLLADHDGAEEHFGMGGATAAGGSFSFVVAPESGSVIAVITNNNEFVAADPVSEVLAAWYGS